jgi:hypothetical protein
MSKRSIADAERLLAPGGAVSIYESLTGREGDRPSLRLQGIYYALPLISSAIRERASAHNRSAERSETLRLSAVSAVVKPAK